MVCLKINFYPCNVKFCLSLIACKSVNTLPIFTIKTPLEILLREFNGYAFVLYSIVQKLFNF